MSPTVLIVDDHAGFRASARRLLSSHGYEVVGEAADAAEALAAAETLLPQVVLLDVGLPDGDGIELARQLGGDSSDRRIVLISSRDGDELAPALRDAPVSGFIAKDELSAATLARLLD
jgi:DNA-binding NarL/FixJ family response regulator